jgi:hypothetical protein
MLLLQISGMCTRLAASALIVVKAWLERETSYVSN